VSLNFSEGRVIREPVGPGNGYWAGAPGAFYEPAEKAWYVTYRLRRPRGVEPDRGGEARIARSTDLINWTDIWSVNKSEYKSASIERSTIHRGPDKIWRYFTSYVDPADGRWCTARLKANDPAEFSAGDVRILFTAKPLGLEGVKDPWITLHHGVYYMFLSIALPTPKTSDKSHATLDIYNTGECVSATGLATSRDLDNWEWQGVIFKPEGAGWDRYCRRINSVISIWGKFAAFYDGSASHEENYEEKTALALSPDLRSWKSLSEDGPVLTSPYASHSLRYIDAQEVGGKVFVFYEYARPDGAHELRLLTKDAAEFLSQLGPA